MPTGAGRVRAFEAEALGAARMSLVGTKDCAVCKRLVTYIERRTHLAERTTIEAGDRCGYE